MRSEYYKAYDFVTKHKISIEVVNIERNHPRPFEENEFFDLYSVQVSRGTESFICDLVFDDDDFLYDELAYAVLYLIPLWIQPTFEEFVVDYYDSDYETVSEEKKRIAMFIYSHDVKLHKNAKRVFGDLFDELNDMMWDGAYPMYGID